MVAAVRTLALALHRAFALPQNLRRVLAVQIVDIRGEFSYARQQLLYIARFYFLGQQLQLFHE